VPIFEKRAAYEAARKTKSFLNRAGGRLGIKPGKRARKQIANKNGEIAALRSELARTRTAARSAGSPAGSTPVFFVVGQKKSGTTWLMQMLDSHPEILCKGEGRFFGASWRREVLKEMNVQQQPSSLYNAVLDAEYLRLWIERSPWTRNDDTDEHLNNLTRMAVDYFLTQKLLKSGKRMVGDKSPLLTPEMVKEIGEIYPETRVIHIIRDGRDAVVSATHHMWNLGKGQLHPEVLAKREAYRKNPRELVESGEGIFAANQLRSVAAEWASRVGRAVEDGPALLGDNYREVRYEDLLERPREEIRQLLEFLGAETSEQSVERCVDAASFEKLTKGRRRGEEAADFVRKGIAGDWRNVFTEQDKQTFKEVAGDVLIKLGYEKDDNW
jgi:hypothetical protein